MNPCRFSARFETRSDGWHMLCGVKRARARQVIPALAGLRARAIP